MDENIGLDPLELDDALIKAELDGSIDDDEDGVPMSLELDVEDSRTGENVCATPRQRLAIAKMLDAQVEDVPSSTITSDDADFVVEDMSLLANTNIEDIANTSSIEEMDKAILRIRQWRESDRGAGELQRGDATGDDKGPESDITDEISSGSPSFNNMPLSDTKLSDIFQLPDLKSNFFPSDPEDENLEQREQMRKDLLERLDNIGTLDLCQDFNTKPFQALEKVLNRPGTADSSIREYNLQLPQPPSFLQHHNQETEEECDLETLLERELACMLSPRDDKHQEMLTAELHDEHAVANQASCLENYLRSFTNDLDRLLEVDGPKVTEGGEAADKGIAVI